MHHISPAPDGFLVRVTRGKVVQQIFIAKGTPQARQCAIAARDRLLAGVPPVEYERTVPCNVRWANAPC
jgi:hypothetical protein